jgi:glycosyltransferase involved in cell wall biosynthesis
MRIALLTAEYPPQPGGVGDYTYRLALALADHAHNPAVLTNVPALAGVAASSLAPEQPPRVLRQIGGWDWRCWRDTIAALDTLRPAVLHIQYQTGAYAMHPAINLLPWRLRALPHRPAVVVTFHDLREPYLFPKAGGVRRWVTLRLARDADHVIATNNDDAAALLAAGVQPSGRITTIPIGSNIPVAPPPGYERAVWRAALGIHPDELVVAYFGLLSHSKGVDLLLDALHHLQAPAMPPIRLLLIGGAATAPQDRAYAASVHQQIDRLCLGERVIVTGHVEPAAVSAHLLASDMVALPFRGGASLRSGSLLAALSHGAAVVTTSTAAPYHPIPTPATAHPIAGEHLLLVPAEDSTALAAALQRLAADSALRARLGSSAQALAAQFSWAAIAQRHAQAYRSLAPHHRMTIIKSRNHTHPTQGGDTGV